MGVVLVVYYSPRRAWGIGDAELTTVDSRVLYLGELVVRFLLRLFTAIAGLGSLPMVGEQRSKGWESIATDPSLVTGGGVLIFVAVLLWALKNRGDLGLS